MHSTLTAVMGVAVVTTDVPNTETNLLTPHCLKQEYQRNIIRATLLTRATWCATMYIGFRWSPQEDPKITFAGPKLKWT